MGDHAECIQLDFDPLEISYEELLKRFFEWHNAFRKPYARQYMSAILYHNEAQKKSIDKLVASLEDDKRKIRSELSPYRNFTWAEDYHQKYYLRKNRTVSFELKQRFPTLEEFVNSHEATRANAILGGFCELTDESLFELGFSPEACAELKNRRKSFFGSLLNAVIPKAH